VRKRIRDGEADIVVGTHALIQESVAFRNLALGIIDEQHRFGVLQRASLRRKGKIAPHLLVMTATPIPRTLAITLYGDFDISVLDEMPRGRIPVRTKVVTAEGRRKVFEEIRSEIARGGRVYVVLPLVEESEKIALRDATRTAERLRDAFPGVGVGLLHGRMKASEKEETMGRFKDGDLQLLVSTTVVEVGVDVPEATVMVVEHAERFGLSQLSPAARKGRARSPPVVLLPDDGWRARGGSGGAPVRHGEDRRRLQDRGGRPQDPRTGRLRRRAPVGDPRPRFRRSRPGRPPSSIWRRRSLRNCSVKIRPFRRPTTSGSVGSSKCDRQHRVVIPRYLLQGLIRTPSSACMEEAVPVRRYRTKRFATFFLAVFAFFFTFFTNFEVILLPQLLHLVFLFSSFLTRLVRSFSSERNRFLSWLSMPVIFFPITFVPAMNSSLIHQDVSILSLSRGISNPQVRHAESSPVLPASNGKRNREDTP